MAAGGEIEEVGVAEDLELLADFVADVAIVGMERAEAIFEGIDIGESEIRAAQGADNSEDVEGPATFLDREFFERAKCCEFFADGFGRDRLSVADVAYSCIGRDSAENVVATCPACAPCTGAERLARNYHRFRKREMRYQK